MASTVGTVARTITSYFPRLTGPASEAYEISRRLEQYGYVSPIFTTTTENAAGPGREVRGHVQTKRFPVTVPFMSFDLSLPFAKAIMKESWDLVHSHGYRDFLALQSYLAARLRRKPFVIQPHGALFAYRYMHPEREWRPYTAYDRLCRRIVLDADRVVVSTDSEAREATKFGVQPDRIAVIPPGVHATRPERPANPGKFRVLFVGRMASGRNVNLLIEAFSRLSLREDEVLTIVGGEEKLSKHEESGYFRQLIRQAHLSRNSQNIEFTGPLYDADLERMYSSSHVFVYPSRYESFSLPILEAAAHGLPVISTPVGVARDIVANAETGFLVGPNDVNGFADRIQELLDDRKKAGEMGFRIRNVVVRKFDWDRTIRAHVALYESVTR